jgi:serine/threonine-protein kinase
MGEVYRADDLKLGQPVALKFLPTSLGQDEDRRRRLRDEVRLARQVAHPHVCRVWDVGEVDGQDFLAMEYVDGEDLASLLRRVGRLPEDRAVRMARELCAGLAAAHGQGILHRDLKPANVMVDGRGHVKLADFGLAAAIEDVAGTDVRSGTPAYMAPEQVEGREVTVRSEVYALGLVLYELFTGQVAYPARTLAEAAQRGETPPPRASSQVEGLDPTIERAIERCLESDPALRPATAAAVAASLPGGDPLAAALAAGETPSPEVVAAAGPRGGLRPGVALGCLAAVAVLWFANQIPGRAINPFDHLPLVKSYEALKENARHIAGRLGYDETPPYSWAAYGYAFRELFHLIQQHGPASVKDHIAQSGQPVFVFGYRQDDEPFVPLGLDGRVSWWSPAPREGDVSIVLDTHGRLTGLRVTPMWRDSGTPPPETDWAGLFELAGLDIARFDEATPTVRPESFADARRAWTGTLPDYDDRAVRIEAASLDGRPVAFSMIISSDARWTAEGGQPPEIPVGTLTAVAALFVAVLLAVFVGGLLLAVRNLKLDRGDRKGAFRLAASVFVLRLLHWVLAGDHVAHPDLLGPLAAAFSGATALAVLTWVGYVACEPYVRRLWPEALVSWTRVLAGRLRDPLVGRDVLAGCTVASAQAFLAVWAYWAAEKAGIVGVIPLEDALVALRGGRYAAGTVLGVALVSVAAGLSIVMLFLLLRMLLRRTWIAGSVLCLLWATLPALQFAGLWGPRAGLLGFAVHVVLYAIFIVLLVRLGLLAFLAAFFLGGLSVLAIPCLDPSSPLFGTGLFIAAVALALAAWAAHASMAGRSWVQDPLPAA